MGDIMRKPAKERKLAKSTNMALKSSDNEVVNFIKILIIVLILVILFTLLTMFLVNKKDKTSDEDVQFQYSKIIVGNILSRNEESYYVLVEKENDTNLGSYKNYISTYKSKTDHLKVYEVDLSDGFNEQYIAEESNLNITNISEIRFKDTTLLKIDAGKITYASDNSEEIETKLKELSA